jgi:ssDNA-binding Zn-finger/Zn-ribbon topoisomerase 1
MSLAFYFNDPCPKCRKPLMQAVIEKHPTRQDLAVQNFRCTDCGPVKTKVISLTPKKPSAELAA